MHNLVWVSWGGALTDYITALIRVKQGAVLSHIPYCGYVDKLLLITFQGSRPLFYRSTVCRRMTSFYWHLSFLRCANFWLYVKSVHANIASPSLHLIPNIWLPYLRTVPTLSKKLMIVCFTSTVGWLTLFIRFLILTFTSDSDDGEDITIRSFCVAWRKSLRRVRGLPFQIHGVLLPLLFQCLPVLDEICRRFRNCVRSCLLHESPCIQFIALHGLHARSRLLVERNVILCAERFICSVNDLINSRIPIIINSYVRNSVEEATLILSYIIISVSSTNLLLMI